MVEILVIVFMIILAVILSIICPTSGDEAWLEKRREGRQDV